MSDETNVKLGAMKEKYENLILQFIGSLTICDHMGDVSNEIITVMEKLDLNIEWNDMNDLGRYLGKRGVTTLLGSPLWSAEDDEEDGDE